jgi:hypothetical protein
MIMSFPVESIPHVTPIEVEPHVSPPIAEDPVGVHPTTVPLIVHPSHGDGTGSKEPLSNGFLIALIVFVVAVAGLVAYFMRNDDW